MCVTLSVLIVDDSRSFLDAVRDLLERQGVRIVGLVSSSAEALRQAAELHPEVILIDITLAGESGSTSPGSWPCSAGARP